LQRAANFESSHFVFERFFQNPALCRAKVPHADVIRCPIRTGYHLEHFA